MSFLYHPFYCEENVWHLGQHARLIDQDKRVVFVSNAVRFCPMWHMRAGGPDAWIAWDYHVFLLGYLENWLVWDHDSLLGMPQPLATYLQHSFKKVRADLEPRFRVSNWSEFLIHFSSDRQHMRSPKGWLSEPPPWPAPVQGPSNLDRWLSDDPTWWGSLMDKNALLATYGLPEEAFVPKQ